MPSTCARCQTPIQDDEPFVTVETTHGGPSSRAHLQCAPPTDRNFRERVALSDHPKIETPRPKDKELRG
jgi:hypothetical protein